MLRRLSTYIFRSFAQSSSKPITRIAEIERKMQGVQSLKECNRLFFELKNIYYSSPERQQFFAISCRSHSQNFRRSSYTEGFDLQKFLGTHYQDLNLHSLQKLDIVYLCDIAYFFCILHTQMFIEVNTTLQNFIDKLLDQILQKSNRESRNLSYSIKAARCAHIFHHKNYKVFLTRIFNKRQHLSPFETVSLMNFIVDNRWDSECTVMQMGILLHVLNVNNLGEQVDTTTLNIFGIVTNLIKNSPFALQLHTTYTTPISHCLTTQLTHNYQNLTNQSIIKYIRCLSSYSNTPHPLNYKYYNLILNSIKQNGQSCFDPIFIIRYISFCYFTTPINRLPEEHQRKIINLYRFYVIQGMIQTKVIEQNVLVFVQVGLFGGEGLLEMLGLIGMYNDRLAGKCVNDRLLIIRYFLHATHFLKLTIRFQLFDLAKQTLKRIIEIFPFQQGKRYTFASVYNKFLQAVKQKQADPKGELGADIKQNKSIIYNKSNSNSQVNIFYKKIMIKILQGLLTTYNYKQIPRYLSQPIDLTILHATLKTCLAQSHPTFFHQPLLNSLNSLTTDKQTLGNYSYYLLQDRRNSKFRLSRSQASFFLLSVISVDNPLRFFYYAHNTVLGFLARFCRKQVVEDFRRAGERAGGMGDWTTGLAEGFYVRVCWWMLAKQDDIRQIWKFMEQIKAISFENQFVLKNFIDFLSLSTITSPTVTKKLTESSKIAITIHPHPHLQYQQAVLSILDPIYNSTSLPTSQTNKLQNNLQKYLKICQAQFSNKSIEVKTNKQGRIGRQTLIRDFILIIRYCNNIMGITKDINHAAQILGEKMGLEIQEDWIKIRLLMLAHHMNWDIPKLYAQISKTVKQGFWQCEIDPSDLMTLLIQYKYQPAITKQHIQGLIILLEHCPDQAGRLSNYLKQIQDDNIYSKKTRAFVQYIVQQMQHISK